MSLVKCIACVTLNFEGNQLLLGYHQGSDWICCELELLRIAE